MTGEGERSFLALLDYYIAGKGDRKEIAGITYRGENGEIFANSCGGFLPMDEIPFMYHDMKEFENKIVYYESSRGCPFSCSCCFSSIDKEYVSEALSWWKRNCSFFWIKICRR